MIKKILATICAVGLIFASCFVGHKIDSKAELVESGQQLDQFNYSYKIEYNSQTYTFLPMGTFQTAWYSGSNAYNQNTSMYVSYRYDETLDRYLFGNEFLFFCSGYSYVDGSASGYSVTSIALNCWNASSIMPLSSMPTVNGGWFSFTSPFSLDCRRLTQTSFSSVQDWLYNSPTTTFQLGLGGSTLTTCGFLFYNSAVVSINSVSFAGGKIAYLGSSWQVTGNLPSVAFINNPSSLGFGYTEEQYLQYGNQQYNQGQQAGYDKGYSAGITAGGNNSFLSLITAVVDAPITAFTSLFNFDILGFNVKNVILSILTAALVIACVRFFSGKFV